MQNKTIQAQDQEIKRLLRTIQDEKCILLLGPESAINGKGERIFTSFLQHFEDYNQPLEYDMDDLINFRGDGSLKNDLLLDMKDYYEEHSQPGSFHKKIACIPFHLVIYSTPDKLLENAFSSYGLPVNTSHYYAKGEPQSISEPTKNQPLIYHLLGTVEEEDSIVLTYEDLFDFIFSVVGGGEGAKPLPTELKYAISNARSFLFLGFDLKKWYVQILFRLFGMHNRSRTPISSDNWDEPTKNFYVNNFQIKLLPADMYALIDALHQETEKSGLLRKVTNIQENDICVEVKKMISENHFAEAFQRLMDYLADKDPNLHNDLVMLSARFHRNEQANERRTLAQTDYQLELNLITYALLNMLDNID
jgi:hypothetical protein